MQFSPGTSNNYLERSLPHQYGHFDDLVFGHGLAERHFEGDICPAPRWQYPMSAPPAGVNRRPLTP